MLKMPKESKQHLSVDLKDMGLRFILIKAERSILGDLKGRMQRGRTGVLIRSIFWVLLTTVTKPAKEDLKLDVRRVVRSSKRNVLI